MVNPSNIKSVDSKTRIPRWADAAEHGGVAVRGAAGRERGGAVLPGHDFLHSTSWLWAVWKEPLIIGVAAPPQKEGEPPHLRQSPIASFAFSLSHRIQVLSNSLSAA